MRKSSRGEGNTSEMTHLSSHDRHLFLEHGFVKAFVGLTGESKTTIICQSSRPAGATAGVKKRLVP